MKTLRLIFLLGLALFLQMFGAAVGTTVAPYPPKWYPLTEYLVSDVLFGLSLAPLLPLLRRGTRVSRGAAIILSITLSVHIVRSVRNNGLGLLTLVIEGLQS